MSTHQPGPSPLSPAVSGTECSMRRLPATMQIGAWGWQASFGNQSWASFNHADIPLYIVPGTLSSNGFWSASSYKRSGAKAGPETGRGLNILLTRRGQPIIATISTGRPARRSSTVTRLLLDPARPIGAPASSVSPTLADSPINPVISDVQPPPWSMMMILP